LKPLYWCAVSYDSAEERAICWLASKKSDFVDDTNPKYCPIMRVRTRIVAGAVRAVYFHMSSETENERKEHAPAAKPEKKRNIIRRTATLDSPAPSWKREKDKMAEQRAHRRLKMSWHARPNREPKAKPRI